MKNIILTAAALTLAASALATAKPNAAMAKRQSEGIEIVSIVHWGLNTFTDREWGFGDEKPEWLDPDDFSADQIVGACKAGGIQGMIVVAKHHDGFCLWPTKTTEHNIAKSPFRGGKGDYVKEMCDACRKAGLKFGVYCSPWDRNNAAYASEEYVKTYHRQVEELNDGRYGEIFEMWFDGANGGTGWYGGAAGPKGERRKIPEGYYRFDELIPRLRVLQPNLTVFGMGGEFAWPGNEQGFVDPVADASDDTTYRVWEADFPLRPGWFYHEKERGRVRHGAYLMKLYLSSVGNGGIMNIGIAPDRHGRLDAEDVRALKDFKTIKDEFFKKEITGPENFNVVVERRDGRKYIHVLNEPMSLRWAAKQMRPETDVHRYFAEPALIRLVMNSTAQSGETDTAKWMTGAKSENAEDASVGDPVLFGNLSDGRETHLWRLKGAGGLVLDVTDYGGRLVRLYAPDRHGNLADVTLGWNTAAEYERNGFSMGTLIGRYGNRIADGRFALDGKTYQLALNENAKGRHCNLHGGPKGWDDKVWSVKPLKEGDTVGLVLTLVSPDGDMGFPGTVKMTVTYRVTPRNVWTVDYEATTDSPTVINPTHHSYWNLAGEASGDVLKQELFIAADAYSPTTVGLIPLKNAPVKGTGFDFTGMRPIGAHAAWMAAQESLKPMDNWYDHNFVLRGKIGELHDAAAMRDPVSGRTLKIRTTEPCLQMYGAQNMDGSLPAKAAGKTLPQFAGVALETQHAPDSPNRPDFPSTVLRPGETFRSRTEYHFGTGL